MSTTLPLAAPDLGVSQRDDEIRRKIDACPKLASLQSVNRALRELVAAEEGLTSQIAEIIRSDPSLSARLLRMVNSVYFGLSARVNNIEEAVFFLGVRRIRELSMATPVIEELENLRSPGIPSSLWQDLWSHSVGTAVLTRELLAAAPVVVDDDTDYLVGLLHHVGKIVMAHAFPQELMQAAQTTVGTPEDVCALERELIGWDHAQIGAYYLERHHIAEEIVCAVRYHHDPMRAQSHHAFAAAVQVADYLVRHAGIGNSFEKVDPIAVDSWQDLPGWKILFSGNSSFASTLPGVLRRLPVILETLL
jgi:HD-like signal output (HDOD) protein